jgi:methylthioribose-1-phosphate isomerase
MIPTLTWTPEGVRFLDQTKLPLEESYVLASTYEQVADVIVTMVVRGAPAIGVSAAYGVALGAKQTKAKTAEQFAPEFERIRTQLAATRPTAVNLFWAIDRMKALFAKMLAAGASLAEIQDKLLAEAHEMYEQDIAACRRWAHLARSLCQMMAASLRTAMPARWPHAVMAWRWASYARPSSGARKLWSTPTRRGRSCKAHGSPRGN